MEGERRDTRFSALADSVAGAIEDRLEEHRLLLRGLAAFFHASQGIGRDEFGDYVARLRIAENHPGTLGVGFALHVNSPQALRAVTNRMRIDGEPTFTPWPVPSRYPASTILLLEPRSPANQRALGFNMFGEPVRREAMERALRTGRAALSGKVQLVQDVSGRDNPGFLIYVPVGREAGARPGTAAQELSGWAYSPLRAHEIIGTALSRPGLSLAQVELFDGAAGPDTLLFRSANQQVPALTAERKLAFGGRTWTVRIGSTPDFFDSEPLPLGWAVALGGGLITLLLAVLAWQQARSASRTEAEVERATADLRRINAELVATARAREEAEAHLRQAQKIESLGQLTGGIAHDFNNMLAVIIGNLDMAERRIDNPERLRRALHNAQEGARRAAELTQRLLAFGRRQPLVPRVLDPNRLVAGMSELLRRTLGEQVRLETVLAGGIWPIEADFGQLENAILNLAINARDAMPGGGRLTIETHNCHLDEAYAARHEGVSAGQYTLIAITDSGAGMAPEVAARALDPFFTTKEVGKGTGLGLSQVFGFVKQSGGHLKIYSEPGEGTTVKLYLPRSQGAVQESADASVPAELPRGHAHEIILVAEDENGVRLTTVEVLRDLGYTVIHAADGAEALRLLEEHGGATLLLTDVVMPGMNGRELSDRACAQYPGLKVLFTTGYTRNAIVHDGRLDPDVALLPKPFTTAQLATQVRQAIHRTR